MSSTTFVAGRRFSPRGRLAGFCLAAAIGAAVAPTAALGAGAFPAEIAAKLDGLTAAQQQFLHGDEVRRLVPTRERLMLELTIRDADAVERYVADMMAALDSMSYQPGVDLAETQLNPEAEVFHHQVLRPQALNKFRRDPGPFSLNRYLFPMSGIPTFAGARVALTPEDLIAGQVDVAIAGIPIDMSSGTRNSKHGPQALRAMHGLGDLDLYSMVNPSAVLNIVDYGDFAIDNMSVERSIDHIADMVEQVARAGSVPMLVGGDHSMLYPAVAGVARAFSGEKLGVVHFGAHPDVKRNEAHTISDVQAVFQLLKHGMVEGKGLVQIGLRGRDADIDTLLWMRSQGIRYHTMAEVEHRGWQAVASRVIDEVRAGPANTYLSFDVSVLDPGDSVAAGRAVPGGLSVREVTPLIRRLCAEKNIVGFEIMDLAPMLDLTYVSAMNANYVMNACLAGMAMRRQGLSPDYVSPIALDHGQR